MNLVLHPTLRAHEPEQPTAETRSQGMEWRPAVKVYLNVDFQELRNRLAATATSNEELLRLAEVQRPPQAWFDAEDDPFTAD